MPTDLTRQFVRLAARDATPDRDLLARFAASRDEDAFGELVRRHGAVVLAACRRVTGHTQDAEDAFQAAFLVLARRAGHVSKPELLSNWLYGVAVRTGLEARAARRRAKEQSVSAVPELPAPAPNGDDDLRAVIDEELARLPEKYRAAVVLCELDGLSRKEAAERLRVPEGTLSSRLAQARKLLAARLTKRVVVATATTVGMTLSRDAAATALPVALEQATARAAAAFAAGGAVPPGLVSSRVSSLTDGVMKVMIVNRLRATLGVSVLAFGLIGLAASGIGQTSAPRPSAATLPPSDPFAPLPGQGGRYTAKMPDPVPAKGIEDDDVPYSSFPAQAVVRIEEGKLIVRQRTRGVFPVAKETTNKDGEKSKQMSYENKTAVVGNKYDASDISVFDMKGNRLAAKAWRDKLKADQHVLLATDGKLPLPRELSLLKDDVLLVVLPAGVGVPGNYGVTYRNYYEPVTGPDGTTRYELRTTSEPTLYPPRATDEIPPLTTPIPSSTIPSGGVPTTAPPAGVPVRP